MGINRLDIATRFWREKCTKNKRGETTEGIELPNQESIIKLEEIENDVSKKMMEAFNITQT